MTLTRRILLYYARGARTEQLSRAVYAALIDQLFGNGAWIGYMMLVVAATILTLVAYHNHPNPVTASILAAMLGIAAGRIVLFALYRKRRAHRNQVIALAAWEYSYEILGVAMALVIGATSAYATLVDQDTNTLIVSIIVTMGVAGGITSRNGSRPKIVFAQIAAVMIPFCAALAFTGTRQGITVAVLFAIYFLSTYLSTKAFYASLRNALANEQRNLVLKGKVQKTATMFDTALNNMRSGVLMLNERHRLVVANDALKEMFGADLIDAMIGQMDHDITAKALETCGLRPQEAMVFLRTLQRALKADRGDPVALTDHRRMRVFDLRGRVMADRSVVITVDDVTEKRTREAEIHRLAHHDVLTGLPNRFSLSQHLNAALTRVDRSMPLVVAYLDLDRFKDVNDEHGHGAGDAILAQVAERIAHAVRRNDYAARISGDEFVLVFEHATDIPSIERTVERLIAKISQPYAIAGRIVEIGASAGLALARDSFTSAEEILRLADVALFEAKVGGRGRAVWFNALMDETARHRRELTADLKHAVDHCELTLVYQPVVDFRTGQVTACEALSRWTHPTQGAIPPSEFIPLAEHSDLIQKLGLWSIRQACLDALQWPDPRLKVAVNLSVAQFKVGDIAARVDEILLDTGFPADRLEFEITESVLVEDLDTMRSQLNALRDLGVSLALDDFGTGYSNLAYLHSLPLNKLKLDRSFVTRLDTDPSAIALVASIVQLAQVLRKDLVIEGVETAQQLAMIAQAQGRLVQGYYFSRPLGQAELVAFISRTPVASALVMTPSRSARTIRGTKSAAPV